MTFNDKVPPLSKRKKNLYFNELSDVLNSVGNSYSGFKKMQYKYNGNDVSGTMYRIDRALTPEQVRWLESWYNCKVTIGNSKNAPEISAYFVFLADKAFK